MKLSITQTSITWRCPIYIGVELATCVMSASLYMEVSIMWRCPLYGGVHYMEVSIIWKCPVYRGAHFMEEISIVWRCPLYVNVGEEIPLYCRSECLCL